MSFQEVPNLRAKLPFLFPQKLNSLALKPHSLAPKYISLDLLDSSKIETYLKKKI